MKGITPIIAIVLLLMITISMAGFAFIWFQRIGSIALNATEAGITAQQQSAGKLIRIDNVDTTNGKVTIRNIGTYTISKNEIMIYVDGAAITASCDKTSITPGQVMGCTADAIKTCNVVKVTAPGNDDSYTC